MTNTNTTTQTATNPFAALEVEASECAFAAGDDHSDPCNTCASCVKIFDKCLLEEATDALEVSAAAFHAARPHLGAKRGPATEKAAARLRAVALEYAIAVAAEAGLELPKAFLDLAAAQIVATGRR